MCLARLLLDVLREVCCLSGNRPGTRALVRPNVGHVSELTTASPNGSLIVETAVDRIVIRRAHCLEALV